MNKNLVTILIVVALVVIGIFIYTSRTKTTTPNEKPPVVVEDSILGCYVATLAKDVYTLTVLSQKGESVIGKLSFKNFQKDSSSGTFVGTYKSGVLLGDYSFQSEGSTSLMEVIFQKQGDNFVRGYGELSEDGTYFTDLDNITYDPNQTFKPSTIGCEVSA